MHLIKVSIFRNMYVVISVPNKHFGLPTSSIVGHQQPTHSPVHLLQQTASNLADAILGVGEKMKGVKDGHTPPWGSAEDNNTSPSPDVDSCKEVNSQSSGNSSVASPEKELPSTEPTVILDSPDTLTVILQEKETTHSSSDSKSKIGLSFVQSNRINENADAIEKQSLGSGLCSTDIKPDRLSYLSNTSVEDEDIVFSSKYKKGRKKRIKSGIQQNLS